jgi:hypothetical protein
LTRKPKRSRGLAVGRRGRVETQWGEFYICDKTSVLLSRRPDHGPPEREQHLGGIELGGRDKQIATALATSVLDGLLHAGALGDRRLQRDLVRRRLDAAETLIGQCRRAGIRPPVQTSGYQAPTSRGRSEMPGRMVVARRVLDQQAAKLGGWDRMSVLMDVLVFDIRPALDAIGGIVAILDSYADLLGLPKPMAERQKPRRRKVIEVFA